MRNLNRSEKKWEFDSKIGKSRFHHSTYDCDVRKSGNKLVRIFKIEQFHAMWAITKTTNETISLRESCEWNLKKKLEARLIMNWNRIYFYFKNGIEPILLTFSRLLIVIFFRLIFSRHVVKFSVSQWERISEIAQSVIEWV